MRHDNVYKASRVRSSITFYVSRMPPALFSYTYNRPDYDGGIDGMRFDAAREYIGSNPAVPKAGCNH
jgi:hypothetical protein